MRWNWWLRHLIKKYSKLNLIILTRYYLDIMSITHIKVIMNFESIQVDTISEHTERVKVFCTII